MKSLLSFFICFSVSVLIFYSNIYAQRGTGFRIRDGVAKTNQNTVYKYTFLAETEKNKNIKGRFPYWEINIQTGYIPLLRVGISISPWRYAFVEGNVGSIIILNEVLIIAGFQHAKGRSIKRLGVGYLQGYGGVAEDSGDYYGPLLYASYLKYFGSSGSRIGWRLGAYLSYTDGDYDLGASLYPAVLVGIYIRIF